MSGDAVPASLSPWAIERIRGLYLRLGVASIVDRVVARVLTTDDRASLPAEAGIWQLLQLWMQLRAVDLPQAVIDLALRVDLLSPGQHADLRDALGIEAAPAVSVTAKPAWDADSFRLLYKNQVAKRFLRPNRSGASISLVEAFEASGWRVSIRDPRPGRRDPERLRELVRSLNSGLLLIRFYCDGTGEGIRWEVL